MSAAGMTKQERADIGNRERRFKCFLLDAFAGRKHL